MTEVMTGRAINRLSARFVSTVKPAEIAKRYNDGQGLYLHVDAAGAKRWVFVFRWRGKRTETGFGSINDVGLAEAREIREAARKNVRNGINPVEARKRIKAGSRTFGEVADELIASMAHGWSNEKHGQQWTNTLVQHAGNLTALPIADVGVDDVLKALRPIWNEKPETARRVRGRIEAVLDAARAKREREGENPARWKGHLDKLLSQSAKLSRGHHAALPYEEAPAFMARLRRSGGMAARMLEFIILTAARPGEGRGAPWLEIEGDLWTVPPERMKERREHRVPLSGAAVAVLDGMREVITPKPADLIFPSPSGKPLSDAATGALLRRMEVDCTTHGFRSTFRDWTGDCTDYPREVAEAALAHLVGDEAERAYRRSDALAKRRGLMEAWAAYLGSV